MRGGLHLDAEFGQRPSFAMTIRPPLALQADVVCLRKR
jgi:hypothetical protein